MAILPSATGGGLTAATDAILNAFRERRALEIEERRHLEDLDLRQRQIAVQEGQLDLQAERDAQNAALTRFTTLASLYPEGAARYGDVPELMSQLTTLLPNQDLSQIASIPINPRTAEGLINQHGIDRLDAAETDAEREMVIADLQTGSPTSFAERRAQVKTASELADIDLEEAQFKRGIRSEQRDFLLENPSALRQLAIGELGFINTEFGDFPNVQTAQLHLEWLKWQDQKNELSGRALQNAREQRIAFYQDQFPNMDPKVITEALDVEVDRSALKGMSAEKQAMEELKIQGQEAENLNLFFLKNKGAFGNPETRQLFQMVAGQFMRQAADPFASMERVYKLATDEDKKELFPMLVQAMATYDPASPLKWGKSGIFGFGRGSAEFRDVPALLVEEFAAAIIQGDPRISLEILAADPDYSSIVSQVKQLVEDPNFRASMPTDPVGVEAPTLTGASDGEDVEAINQLPENPTSNDIAVEINRIEAELQETMGTNFDNILNNISAGAFTAGSSLPGMLARFVYLTDLKARLIGISSRSPQGEPNGN